MSVDVPGRLQTIEAARGDVASCCRSLSPSWMGLVMWRCHVVVVLGVVEQLQEAMVETKQRWWMMVVEKERICLFTMCM